MVETKAGHCCSCIELCVILTMRSPVQITAANKNEQFYN